jgi:hypothetical protein
MALIFSYTCSDNKHVLALHTFTHYLKNTVLLNVKVFALFLDPGTGLQPYLPRDSMARQKGKQYAKIFRELNTHYFPHPFFASMDAKRQFLNTFP